MTTPLERDSIHELLCAYLLGEVDEAERARVEAALAASAELRAERDRLTGTIGLVQSAYDGEERLSDEALAAIVGAAEQRASLNLLGGTGSNPGGGRAWYHSPGLRAAAAVVAMLGGVLAILSYGDGPGYTDTETDVVADALREEFAKSRVVRDEAAAAPAEVAPRAESEALAPMSLAPREGERELLLEQVQIDGYIEQAKIALGAQEKDKAEAYLGLALRSAPDNQEAQVLYQQYQQLEAPDFLVFGEQGDGATIDVDGFGVSMGQPSTDPSVVGGRTSGQHTYERKLSEGAKVDSGGVGTDPLDRGLSAGGERSVVGRSPQSADGEAARSRRRGGAEAPAPAPSREKAGALPGLGATREQDAAGVAALGSEAVETRTDDSFLGRDATSKLERGVNGAYRGPGDSVPSGGQPATRPDAAGPSTPGPAGPVPDGDVRLLRLAKEGLTTSTGTPVAPPAAKTVELEELGQIRDLRGRVENRFGEPVDSPATAGGGAGGVSSYGLYDDGKRADVAQLLDGDEEDAVRVPITRYRRLAPEQLGILVDSETERILRDCRRHPHERPRDMFFRFWGDNAFAITSQDPLSTFSVDVDTASYALARRYLNEGHIPEKAQVRTEEFVNYFDPDLDPPAEGTFAIHTELAPSLFGGSERRWMLRVGVRGKVVDASERQPLALTFVVDTSGSMRENGRLELVKFSMRQLVGQLDARDSIAIVAFNKETRLVLPMTPVSNRGLIESAIHPLSPGGSTNAEAGLRMGYEAALGALDPNVHNRVVLLSDGVANVGQTDQDRINADVARHRARGVYLNTIGVGMNNHNDVFLEQLANKGDGICDYIDSPEAAERAIVERFTGAFVPIASDVKIQVEFDPAQVHRYRLLGYENRAIADKDFRNDAVDAGEVGSGHQVVALYEIERTSGAATEMPLATVRLRWKAPKAALQDPSEVDVTETSREVRGEEALGSFDSASPGYRRAVLVAQFAEFLRRSVHARGDSYEALTQEAGRLAPQLTDPDFDEFVTLVERAFALELPRAHFARNLDGVIDEYRRFQYLRAQLEDLERKLGDDELRDLQRTNEQLERRIRDLIREDIERKNG